MAQERDNINRMAEYSKPSAAATATHYGNGRNSEEIRRDIEHTRDEMSGTINEIERRLSPQRLWNEMLDMLKSETQRSRVLNAIKENIVPSALMAAGAVWMAIEVKHPKYKVEAVETETDIGPVSDIESGGFVGELGAGSQSQPASSETGSPALRGRFGVRAKSEMKEKLGSAKDKVSDIAESAKSTAHRAKDKSAEVYHRAEQSAREAASRAREVASSAADRAQHMAVRAKEEAVNIYENHPLALSGLVVGAGLLLGLLLPRTRKEDELMGEAAGRVKDGARNVGHDIAERGKQVGRAAIEAADAEAEKQDLTSDKIATSISGTAREATEKVTRIIESGADAAESEARRQDLTPEQLAERAEQSARQAGREMSGEQEDFEDPRYK